MHWDSARLALVSVICLAISLSGCVFGPTALRMSRSGYNEAIQQTNSEQLLLNLVRLRYRDIPFVLEVGTVSAQFELRQDVGVVGTLNENVGPDPLNPNSLTANGGLTFVDRPTVTFTPIQGQEFVQRLMTPLTLDTVVLLERSGWSIERVLRLTAQHLNGLDNATRATGPTPDEEPSFREFARACALIRQLQLRREIAVGYVNEEAKTSPPLPHTAITVDSMLLAAKEGYRISDPDERGECYVLGPRRRLELQFSRAALSSPEARELTTLLKLDPGCARHEIIQIGTDLIEPDDPESRRSSIVIATRALLGMMFFLSQGIEVPRAHEDAGLVTVTRGKDGSKFDWASVTGDQLRVRCQRFEPRNAAVAVPYRGHWFFIADDDLSSKSTFALMSQLMSLQTGVEAAAGPLLTLPVGG